MRIVKQLLCMIMTVFFFTFFCACGQLSRVINNLEKKKNSDFSIDSTTPQSSTGETAPIILSETVASETTTYYEYSSSAITSEAYAETITQQSIAPSGSNIPSPESETQASIEDLLSGLEGIPSFGTGMFLDPSDPNRFSPLIYTGTDFTFYYQITAGDMNVEYGIGFMLNGIYQDIRIEGKDLQTGYDTMHVVSVPAGTTKIYKVFLRPNIGCSGETLKFTNATIVDPNKRVTNQNDTYTRGQLSLNATLSSPFIMQADSNRAATVCTNYSGESHKPYNRNIRAAFSATNNTGELCQILMGTDVNSMVTYDLKDRNYLTDPRISLNRSASAQMKIVLGGGRYGTTQRVSLYVNGKPQPVFDGMLYADISIDRTNQTELTIALDTTNLPEWNGIYLLAYTMDDSTLSSPVAFRQSDPYVLHVEG